MLILQLFNNDWFFKVNFRLFFGVFFESVLCQFTQIFLHVLERHLLGHSDDPEAHVFMMPYFIVLSVYQILFIIFGTFWLLIDIGIRALA